MYHCTKHVLYVPGLNRRLFSIPAFVRDAEYQVSFTTSTTRFHLGDGQTLEIPTIHKPTSTLINEASVSEKTDTSMKLSDKKPLPTISVEKGHRILGHRSIRSLISGSLHQVWDDYQFISEPDSYCESCKISACKI